jgi:hypothetical protein
VKRVYTVDDFKPHFGAVIRFRYKESPDSVEYTVYGFVTAIDRVHGSVRINLVVDNEVHPEWFYLKHIVWDTLIQPNKPPRPNNPYKHL